MTTARLSRTLARRSTGTASVRALEFCKARLRLHVPDFHLHLLPFESRASERDHKQFPSLLSCAVVFRLFTPRPFADNETRNRMYRSSMCRLAFWEMEQAALDTATVLSGGMVV